ncbi:MAG: sulfide/dihydroorotate dehydrogenase-like FAD/NAD-binding protein [Candidatus Cloacimonetes bacterium]|nr:sulfide/dihydroorotate dehydrogenase-like FAD/NAD-binding protein [Candidatus Cloacimonadota bacterium]
MFEIIRKEEMAEGTIVQFDISAPKIAAKVLPGQFIILRLHEKGERIPLTVADADPINGIITLIIQVVGKTTAQMKALNEGEFIKDIVGPLGKQAHCEKKNGIVIIVAGGTGIAISHHVAKGMKKTGNYVIGIIGARTKDMLILEDEMRALCDELIITTDDGSYGEKGFVTMPLERILNDRDDVAEAYAIGPIVMMRNVLKVTNPKGVHTMVSLNPVMIDGTGMCGGCRITVGGEMKFACVDGPDFDGSKVDFDELLNRNSRYLKEEKDSLLFSVKKV